MAAIGTIIIPYEWTLMGDLITIEDNARYAFQNNIDNVILFYEGDASPGFDDEGKPILTGFRLYKGQIANYQRGSKNLYARSLCEHRGKNPVYKSGRLVAFNNK
jgi:hypothetical protein